MHKSANPLKQRTIQSEVYVLKSKVQKSLGKNLILFIHNNPYIKFHKCMEEKQPYRKQVNVMNQPDEIYIRQ